MKHAAQPGAIVLASTLGVAAQRGAQPRLEPDRELALKAAADFTVHLKSATAGP